MVRLLGRGLQGDGGAVGVALYGQAVDPLPGQPQAEPPALAAMAHRVSGRHSPTATESYTWEPTPGNGVLRAGQCAVVRGWCTQPCGSGARPVCTAMSF